MLKQSLQQSLLQKLSPQQIQLMKMLQLPTLEMEQRIKEAEKLGYSKIFISKYCDKIPTNKIKVIYLSNITDLMSMLTI